jgi:ATP-dependent Clp protease ATP-binding subunit ClpC
MPASCETGPTFERFTDRARRVLVLAQEEARRLNHSFIGTEHILLGLISEGDGVAAQALDQLDVSLQKVREKVEETVGVSLTTPTGSASFTPRAKKVLELALREALQLGHNYIGTEHLLLGLLREGEGVAAQVLVSLGVDLRSVREQVMRVLEGYRGSETPNTRGSLAAGASGFPTQEIGRWRLDPRSNGPVERVGKECTARVVRTGRTPPDYEAAYQELGDMLERMGIAIGDPGVAGILVSSIDTDEGPGLELSISQRVEEGPYRAGDDENGDPL